MKCQKMKKYLYRGLSVFMGLYLSLCSCIGSYASDSTSSGATDTWTMNAGTFLELAFNGFAKEISSPYVIWNTLTGCTYDGFNVWLQNQDNGEHYHLLSDGEVVGHGGAGYSRPSDKINNSTEIDVQPELTQYVLNYIQYCTTQTSLGYHECYIHSINFLNTSQWTNYQQYKGIIEYAKQNNGYIFLRADKTQSYSTISPYGQVTSVPRTSIDFVGTTTNGIFNSVRCYANWSEVNWGNYIFTVYNQSGSSSTSNGMGQNYVNIYNTTGTTNNCLTCFTSGDKDELVYVFDSVNAYKNYVANSPQPYYLTTDGINTGTWTASGGGIINTGSMNNSGNYYSSVTSGVGSNWTPDQILALVDKVANANNGSGGSGSSSNENNNSKWWERLGDAIGNIIDGIISVLTTVIEHLSDALLSVIHLLTGYTDDNGTVHEGLFGKLLTLVNSGFNNFLASIFSWLPEEIVTLFTAVLVFGIFFGLLKMLRR